MNKEIVKSILKEIEENNVTELSAYPIKKEIKLNGVKVVEKVVGCEYTISVEYK